MFNDPRTRLRKLVSGVYAMVRKARKPGEVYSAAIENTAPAEYTVTITDKAKEVISVSTVPTLAIARKTLRGQLASLDVRLSVLEPKAIPIDPPSTGGIISSIETTSDSLIAGTYILITAYVEDSEGNPLPGKTVLWTVDNVQDEDTLTAINEITDSNGASQVAFTSTKANATFSRQRITAQVDDSSDSTPEITIEPDLATMTLSGDVTVSQIDTNKYAISSYSNTAEGEIKVLDQYGNPPLSITSPNALRLDGIIAIRGSDAGIFCKSSGAGPGSQETTLPDAVLDYSYLKPFDPGTSVTAGAMVLTEFTRDSGSGPGTITLYCPTNTDPASTEIELSIPFT